MPHRATLRSLQRAPLVLFLLAAGLTCRDRSVSGPGLPGRAALDVAPVFQTVERVPGTPVIRLANVRAVLIAKARASRDTATATAGFEGDSAVLRFELTVAAPSELFTLEVEATDSAGVVVFRGTDTVRVAPGLSASRGAPLLEYVAPDTAVRWLVLTPLDTILEAGESMQVTAQGFAADETELRALHLGWLARDPLVASVSAAGMITASNLEGETWILARTFTGVTDSAHVIVRGGVASVVISPDTALTIVDNSVPMYAEVRDAAGTVLSGEGREVIWTTIDPQLVSLAPMEQLPPLTEPVASISPMTSGIASTAVIGLAPGIARIVATSGTHADTAHVRVERNAGIVTVTTVTPGTDTLTSLGDTTQLLAASYDALGAPAAGTYTWRVQDPSVASVSALGTVVAVAPGETWVVVVESGGTKDSSLIVVNQRVAGVVIAPEALTFSALGQVTPVTATAYDAAGAPVDGPVDWTIDDPAVATLGSVQGASATVAAAGNGTTVLRATLRGVEAQAVIQVEQKPAAIEVSPKSVVVGIGGSAHLAPQVLDANGFAIAGFPLDALLWEIADPKIVKVDRGLVQGLVQGQTTVWATAEGIRSADILVDVTDAVPAAISFGRDTIAVGLSESVDVPILLSRPYAQGAVVVELSVSDPAVVVEPTIVRFEQGVTSSLVTIRGRVEKSAILTAVDSLTGYGKATAVIQP